VESFQGVIHGGIIASVLDEAMSKSIISEGDEAFTADLRIRFRKKVCVEDVVFVSGWVVNVEKRKYWQKLLSPSKTARNELMRISSSPGFETRYGLLATVEGEVWVSCYSGSVHVATVIVGKRYYRMKESRLLQIADAPAAAAASFMSARIF